MPVLLCFLGVWGEGRQIGPRRFPEARFESKQLFGNATISCGVRGIDNSVVYCEARCDGVLSVNAQTGG
jgi:hypothetical protein